MTGTVNAFPHWLSPTSLCFTVAHPHSQRERTVYGLSNLGIVALVTVGCDIIVRLYDAIIRLCDAMVRVCVAMVAPCGAIVRLCDVTVRLCDVTVRLCDVTVPSVCRVHATEQESDSVTLIS